MCNKPSKAAVRQAQSRLKNCPRKKDTSEDSKFLNNLLKALDKGRPVHTASITKFNKLSGRLAAYGG